MQLFSSISFLTKGLLITQLALLLSCSAANRQETLASLEDVEFEVKEEKVDGSLDKAMASYERFLEVTPETEMTPEALRRLADLKIQKEYDLKNVENTSEVKKELPIKLSTMTKKTAKAAAGSYEQATAMKVPNTEFKPIIKKEDNSIVGRNSSIADVSENEELFSNRAGEKIDLGRTPRTKITPPGEKNVIDEEALHAARASDAIKIYQELIKKYPLFERNDQVLYQLSRAYEEIGQIDNAMNTLETLIRDYPDSRHIDETQFRRAEYFFTRKKYLDSEESYQAVINTGEASEFYELALYKQGWAFL